MTYREYVATKYPKKIGSDNIGGVEGCPHDLEELNALLPEYCRGGIEEMCRRCWDREIEPYESRRPKNYKHVYEIGLIFKDGEKFNYIADEIHSHDPLVFDLIEKGGRVHVNNDNIDLFRITEKVVES